MRNKSRQANQEKKGNKNKKKGKDRERADSTRTQTRGERGQTDRDKKDDKKHRKQHACTCATPPTCAQTQAQRRSRSRSATYAYRHYPPIGTRENDTSIRKSGPTSEGSASNNFLQTHSHTSSDHESELAVQSSYRRMSWYSNAARKNGRGQKQPNLACYLGAHNELHLKNRRVRVTPAKAMRNAE